MPADSSHIRRIVLATRLVVLAGAALLVAVASIDTFRSRSFVESPSYMKLQLAICVVFLADLVVEFFYSEHRRHYAATHWPFLLLCIPYVALFRHLGLDLGMEWNFVLALVPVLRAAFVFAAVLSAFNAGKATSLFGAYIVLLLFVLYISSMMFYVAEYGVNPMVHSYRSAIYWAVMAMTTTGCNITEMTMVGEAVAAVLSAMGLVLFPVFTIYISNAIGGRPDNQS